MKDYKFGDQQNAVENIDTAGEHRPELADTAEIKKKSDGEDA